VAVLDIGTLLGRGTVAFDTKLGQPIGLRSLAGRALEPCENRVGRPSPRQFRRSKVRQLRSFEETQPAGKTQGKGQFETRAVLRGAQFRIVVVGNDRVPEKSAPC
jgi:hypothetical protein